MGKSGEKPWTQFARLRKKLAVTRKNFGEHAACPTCPYSLECLSGTLPTVFFRKHASDPIAKAIAKRANRADSEVWVTLIASKDPKYLKTWGFFKLPCIGPAYVQAQTNLVIALHSTSEKQGKYRL